MRKYSGILHREMDYFLKNKVTKPLYIQIVTGIISLKNMIRILVNLWLEIFYFLDNALKSQSFLGTCRRKSLPPFQGNIRTFLKIC